MNIHQRANRSFQFYTVSYLLEITPRTAATLEELRDGIREADDAAIFCHTHQALRDYHFADALYQNDFAYWAAEMLGDSILAEKFASMDMREFTTIDAIRKRLAEMIDTHLQDSGSNKRVTPGRELHFTRSIALVAPLPYVVQTLDEFCAALRKVGLSSLSLHLFDARLRLGKPTNDFSMWIDQNLGNKELAKKIEMLDPYLDSLNEIREKIIRLIMGPSGGGLWSRLRLPWMPGTSPEGRS